MNDTNKIDVEMKEKKEEEKNEKWNSECIKLDCIECAKFEYIIIIHNYKTLKEKKIWMNYYDYILFFAFVSGQKGPCNRTTHNRYTIHTHTPYIKLIPVAIAHDFCSELHLLI